MCSHSNSIWRSNSSIPLRRRGTLFPLSLFRLNHPPPLLTSLRLAGDMVALQNDGPVDLSSMAAFYLQAPSCELVFLQHARVSVYL